jgi:hypothetical protein
MKGQRISYASSYFESGKGVFSGSSEFLTDFKKMPTTLTINAKVCRKTWFIPDVGNAAGVSKGSYWLGIGVVLDGSSESADVDVMIKFT